MIPLGDALPYVGLGCAIACLVAALIGRWRRWAVGAAIAVFAWALAVPPPLEAAQSAAMGLHPFPVSFGNLILATAATLVGLILHHAARGVAALIRRLRR